MVVRVRELRRRYRLAVQEVREGHPQLLAWLFELLRVVGFVDLGVIGG